MPLDTQDPPTVFSLSSDPITAGFTLPPDDEPEPYEDEPVEPYKDEPTEAYYDEPVLMSIALPQDEAGHEFSSGDVLHDRELKGATMKATSWAIPAPEMTGVEGGKTIGGIGKGEAGVVKTTAGMVTPKRAE
jgi:hypothetical protein